MQPISTNECRKFSQYRPCVYSCFIPPTRLYLDLQVLLTTFRLTGNFAAMITFKVLRVLLVGELQDSN